MPTPVGPKPDNPAMPHFYIWAMKNNKAKRNLSSHSKKKVKPQVL